MTWEFRVGVVPACGEQAGAEITVQMATQDTTTWPLVAPDWSNPTVIEPPFSIGKTSGSAPPDAGAWGSDEITLEADNLDLGGFRFYDFIRGRATSYPFSIDDVAIHVRVLHEPSYASSPTYRYWGVVDYTSIEAIIGDVSDPDTYKVKFKVVDSLLQLETVELSDFADDMLDMATTSYQATQKYLTRIGQLTVNIGTIEPGAYRLINVRYDDGATLKWMGERQSPAVADGDSAVQTLRYHRLVDIIQAVHDYLGLEAQYVNDGSPWGDVNPWRWYYNYGSPIDATPANRTQLTAVPFNQLAIVSGFLIWDGTQNVYAHRWTFFDRDKQAPHSFFHGDNPLEMLRKICASFGMIARVNVNSAGERYLEVKMADSPALAITWFDDNEWESDVKIKPYSRRVSGIQVNTSCGYTDMTRGNLGSGSFNIDCDFSVCNACFADTDALREIIINGSGNTIVYGNSQGRDFYGALWALTGSPTGQVYPTAHSICAILPVMSGTYAQSVGGTGPYISIMPTGNSKTAAGMVVTTYGGITFNTGASNVVLYPNDAQPVNTWAEVPAMALSHYYFTPYSEAVDRVGMYRSIGMQIDITRMEVFNTLPTPGSRVEIIIGNDTYVGRVVSYEEDYLENKTKFVIEVWSV